MAVALLALVAPHAPCRLRAWCEGTKAASREAPQSRGPSVCGDGPTSGYAFDERFADLPTLVRRVGALTGQRIVVPPGRLSTEVRASRIRARTPLERGDILQAFDDILSAGCSASVPADGGFVVTETSDCGRDYGTSRVTCAAVRSDDLDVTVEVMRLRRIDVDTALQVVRSTTSPRGFGELNRDEATLMVIDVEPNASCITRLLARLDEPAAGYTAQGGE